MGDVVDLRVAFSKEAKTQNAHDWKVQICSWDGRVVSVTNRIGCGLKNSEVNGKCNGSLAVNPNFLTTCVKKL